jgi:DNA mismatch endonuclease (patch repair protein)
MADILTPEERSRHMAKIGPKDSKPELLVRAFLREHGIGYRLHVKGLPGRPDVVMPGRKVVIFVHGCFWHRHPGCRYAYNPKTRPEFWATKFAQNVERDQRVTTQLEADGWKVLVVWECGVRELGWLLERLEAPRQRSAISDQRSAEQEEAR